MKLEKIKITTWVAKCKNCGEVRTYYNLWTFLDGTFLGYTEQDEFALLDAYEDRVYDEVINLVKKILKKSYFDNERTKYALGYACDLSSKGLRYEFYSAPFLECRKCRKQGLVILTEPSFIDAEVPYVGHIAWTKLDDAKKEMKIKNALQQLDLLQKNL